MDNVSKPTVPGCRVIVDGRGTIRFTVTSRGTTIDGWERYFDTHGYRLSASARIALRCNTRPPTINVPYRIAVLPCVRIRERDRVTRKIFDLARMRHWQIGTHWEVPLLIRKGLSDDELAKMGIWWIAVTNDGRFNRSDVGFYKLERYHPGKWIDHVRIPLSQRWNSIGAFGFVEGS